MNQVTIIFWDIIGFKTVVSVCLIEAVVKVAVVKVVVAVVAA